LQHSQEYIQTPAFPRQALGIVSCSNLLLNIIQLDIPSVGFVAREKCVVSAEGTRKIRKFAFGNISLLGGIIGGT
jgi:hypothetical protein